MNKLLIIISGLIFFLFSCEKDISNEKNGTGGVGGPSSVELLTAMRIDYERSQIEYEYLYDADNRLVRENQLIISPGTLPRESHRIFVRNTDGIVVKAFYASIGNADSIISTVNYNAANRQYISVVSKSALGNINYYDSAVYVYDAIGKIKEVDEYIPSTSGSISPIPAQRDFYTFDASGNITYVKSLTYDYMIGVEQVNNEYFISYDSNINPLILPFGEAMIYGDISKASPNNAIKSVNNDILGGGRNNSTVDMVYTYTTKSKPATSSITQSNGITYNKTYTYK